MIDAAIAFAEISRYAGDVPAKSESDFFVGSAAQFETKSCGNSSGMGYEAQDVDTTVMIRVRISEAAAKSQVIPNIMVT